MYMTINDTSYWYECCGEGEAVILLHGFTGSAATWDDLVCDLQDLFQVVTLDLPGHRYTEPESMKTMEAFCYDLSDLMDRLGFTQAHLIGYSMGGRAALSFAMLYPDRVASLVLESASPGLSEENERAYRRQQDHRLAVYIEQEGIKPFVDYWEDLPLFSSQQQLSDAARTKIRMERLLHSPDGLSQSLRYMGTGMQPSWWESLPQLSCPVLLFSGEKDQKFIDLNQIMEKHLPNARHKTINSAGHTIHVEQPAVFDKLVKNFLQSCNRHPGANS